MRNFYLTALNIGALLTFPSFLSGQCPDVVHAGDDIYLCTPTAPVQLDGSIDGFYLGAEWTPATGVSDPISLTPVVTTDQTRMFELKATVPSTQNLIFNGDFELGNVGFSSDLTYSPQNLYPVYTYDVLTNPQDANDGFAACADHTSGGGNMLASNILGTTLHPALWCQTVPVEPHKPYYFSIWGTPISAASGPTVWLYLTFTAGVTTYGYHFVLPGGSLCNWSNYAFVWTNNNSTSVKICVKVHKSFSTPAAIDDIFFAPFCTARDSMTIHVETPKALASPPKSIIPCAGNNVILSGAGSSTGPHYSYSWQALDGGNVVSGGNTLAPTVNAAGQYELTVRYNNGFVECTATDTVLVEEFNNFNAWVIVPAALNCSNATASLHGGANQPATYQWTALTGGNIVSGANASTAVVDQSAEYHLVVTNPFTGCTAETSAYVDIDINPPNAAASIDSIDCSQQRIFLSGTGSSPGAVFAWNSPNGNIVSGADSLVAVVDTPGAYILLVTNPLNHCTATDTVLVAADTLLPLAVIQPSSAFDCMTDSLTLSATAGPTNAALAWSAGPGGQISGRTDTTSVVVTAPGIYLLTVTNPLSGCTAVFRDTVVQDLAPPVAQIQPATTLTCLQSSLSLSADSSSSGQHITYAWTAAAGGNIVGGADSAAPVVNAPGWYYLLVTDTLNGCTAVDSIAVTADTMAVIAVANAFSTLTCATTQVVLDATGSSPDSTLVYHWSTANGHIVSGADTPAPLVDAPGTYQLLLTNPANGCSATDMAAVEQNIAAPELHILPPNGLSCAQPLIALQAQVANPSGSFVYAWSASNGGHIVLGDSLLTLCVDAAGTYTLLSTNPENGCTATASVDVVADFAAPGAAIAVSGVLNCHTTTVSLTGASIADPDLLDHNWTAPDGSATGTGTDPVFAATLPGDYLLVVSNTQNGCTGTATATVFARDPVKSGIIDLQNVSCFGEPSGSAIATATGGDSAFTYLWSNDAATPAITNLAAGTYTVTVSDGDNCTATAEATIQQPDKLLAIAGSTPPSIAGAADGTATVQVAGGTPGYHYLWSTGAIESMISGLTAGFYTVTVTDANDCAAVRSVEVGEADCNLLAGISSINPSCHGLTDGQATVAITNGANPLNFVWSSGGTGQTETGLAAGTYTYTVTDGNGCGLSGAVELTEPEALTLAIGNVVNTSCANAAEGSANAAANGGTGFISFIWSNGQTGPVANHLLAGAYTVTATDANGCTALATTAVSSLDAEAPVIMATDTTVALGPSGSVELTLLNLGIVITDNCTLPGFSFSQVAFDCSQVGSYAVTITAVDSSGNTSSATITVTVIDNLAPVIECPANLVRCAEAATVEYPAPVATDNCLGLGGQFNLTSGLPSGSEFPPGTTTNTYTFTDASGNVGSCSIDVTILSPLNVELDTVFPDIGNGKVGGVNVTVGGSQPGYTFAWTLGGQTVATAEDLAGVGMGLYTLAVTDANGCTATAGPYEVTNVSGTNNPAWMDRIGVFPNPTPGKLFILLPNDLTDSAVQISVSDLTGRQVLDQQFSRQKQLTVDLSAFAEGLYTVAVRVEGQQGVWKVVRTR